MFKNDYSFKGEHADMIRYMVASSEAQSGVKSADIFDYGYQVLLLAPLIGASYGLREKEMDDNTLPYTIKAIQVIKNEEKLETIYNLIMLSDNSLGLSPDEKIDFIFRATDETRIKGLNLFHEYTLGGISWLYNNLLNRTITSQDYLENIMDLIHDYELDFGLSLDIGYEEEPKIVGNDII